MSNEMKMSDVFPEAFAAPCNPSFGIIDVTFCSYGVDTQTSCAQDSAIEHAVLTHDQHVERIAELEKLNGEFADFAERQGWRHALIDQHHKLLEQSK